MTLVSPPNRCRIVLVAPLELSGADLGGRLAAAFDGGDVASFMLPQGTLDADRFQALAEPLVLLAQERGAAAVIAGDSRVAGRLGADGIHVEGGRTALAEAIARAEGRIAVGAGGVKTRDEALALGEERPDYLFFGRFGFDEKPEPHPRNLALGRWWAEMISIPSILAAGSDIASVETVAATGVEFVALGAAVFGEGVDAREAVAAADALLERAAPRWDTTDA